MQQRNMLRTTLLFLVIVILMALGTIATPNTPTWADPAAIINTTTGLVAPTWSQSLPARMCPGEGHPDCHQSSPAIADVDGDGNDDIVVATNSGHVLAYAHDGTLLWDTDIAPAFGLSPNSQEVRASPSVADLDADGYMEIVVATETEITDVPGVCVPGGVLVLSHEGVPIPGWPRLGEPDNDGCAKGFFSTPALGDMDNDGDLEIVIGGFDKVIRVWHHDGTPLAGFAVDSFHYQFRGWDNLIGRLGDSIWSSPALADIDGDGYRDIVINTDEGYSTTFGNWDCPYALPPGWPNDYCGGSTYVVDRFGDYLPGFPRYTHEIMQSSPAIADLDKDGSPEIVTGTGTFYYRNSPDHPLDGARVFIWTADGGELPGWEGGKVVDSPTPSSPAIGDLDGDGEPEVVIITFNGYIYAWHANGDILDGFPMQPVTHFGDYQDHHSVGEAVVLADYDGDSKMEIVLALGWALVVVDGDGTQLTARFFPSGNVPIYVTGGPLLNTPAVGDLDGNGMLEMVAFNSELTVWEIAGASSQTAWPMFRHSATRQGGADAPQPRLMLPIETMRYLYDNESDRLAKQRLTLAPIGGDFAWEITVPEMMTVSPATGFSSGGGVELLFKLDGAALDDGAHEIGDVEFTVEVFPALGESVMLYKRVLVIVVVGDIQYGFVPLVSNP